MAMQHFFLLMSNTRNSFCISPMGKGRSTLNRECDGLCDSWKFFNGFRVALKNMETKIS